MPPEEHELLATLAVADSPIKWSKLSAAVGWDGNPPERLLTYGLLLELEEGMWLHEALRERFQREVGSTLEKRKGEPEVIQKSLADICWLSQLVRAGFGTIPVWFATIFPLWNKKRAGMPRTPSFAAFMESESVFTLAIVTGISSAICSKIGPVPTRSTPRCPNQREPIRPR